MPRFYSIELSQFSYECSALEAVKKGPESEAKESPMLEAVARERLVKTQVGKRLTGCYGNL
jgi:hypothetical protein